MQRWLKLPDGRYIDANRIAYVSKVETYAQLGDEGDQAGVGYSVHLGTDFPREHQITVTGSKDEILALLKSLLGAGSA